MVKQAAVITTGVGPNSSATGDDQDWVSDSFKRGGNQGSFKFQNQ
jgi:hypothetical protein